MAYEDLSDEDRKSLGLGQLLRQAKDPAAQEEWKRLAKKINPNLQFPELELTDKFDKLEKRQSDWEEKQEQRRTEDRTAKRHEAEARAAEAAACRRGSRGTASPCCRCRGPRWRAASGPRAFPGGWGASARRRTR